MGAVQYQGVRKGGKEGLYHLGGISIAHFLRQADFFFFFLFFPSGGGCSYRSYLYVFLITGTWNPASEFCISISAIYISELSKKCMGITGGAGGLYERSTRASEKDECK